MKKYKELLKNIGVLTISNFGSKILSFFLIPLYTSVLTTEQYGNYDFINITISLLFPLLTLNISEAAWRYLLDNKNSNKDKKDICTITFKLSFISIIVLVAFSFINSKINLFPILNKYNLYFFALYITFMIYQTMQNITRGFDKLNSIAISGFINASLVLILNILFLVVLKLELKGYFLATILANVISTLYLFIDLKISKYTGIKVKNKKLEKELTNYSKPLMINSIGWWINGLSDRYIVVYLCGYAVNGIYSVAYKIPSILSVIQSIFNQAWTVSAVKSFENKDNDNFIINIYGLYNCFMVIGCSIIIVSSKILAKILYMKEFYNAWEYVPFLTIALVFGGLSGLIGGIFSAEKNSKVMGYTTIIGAIINIIFNFLLVFYIGALGAAISTLFSFFIVWLIRLIVIMKRVDLGLKLSRDFIAYTLLIIQSILLLIINNSLFYIVGIIITFILLILYFGELKKLVFKILKRN